MLLPEAPPSVASRMRDLVGEILCPPERPSPEALLRADPTQILAPLGMEADPWQRELLTCPDSQILVCCSRQSGKSRTAAAMALVQALVKPASEVLLISKALRQSAELLRKVKELYRALQSGRTRQHGKWRPKHLKGEVAAYDRLLKEGRLVETSGGMEATTDNVLSMEFQNGSRITSLPGTPDTVVGFSAIDLLVIDEAARTPDDLYHSLRPMLAVSRGTLLALSTPFGKRGWFHNAWERCDKVRRAIDAHRQGADLRDLARLHEMPLAELERAVAADREPWKRIRATVDQCPRIDPVWLEEERVSIGDRWYAQEYLCQFMDTVDAVFAYEDIHQALTDAVAPLEF